MGGVTPPHTPSSDGPVYTDTVIFLYFISFTAVECEADEFQCRSTVICLDANELCNGYVKCPDASDEDKCGKKSYTLYVPHPS